VIIVRTASARWSQPVWRARPSAGSP